MGVATRRTKLKRINQKTSCHFALIKWRLGLKVRLPQAPTCCTAVAVVGRFGSVGWLHRRAMKLCAASLVKCWDDE